MLRRVIDTKEIPMQAPSSHPDISVPRLRATFDGRVIAPDDAGDRTPWITMIRVREGETPMEDRWSSTIQ
jgi:hypothetical protein